MDKKTIRNTIILIKSNPTECVLISPEEYIRLVDELNDAQLLNLAAERLAQFNPATVITQDQMEKEFGLPPLDKVHDGDINIM